MVLFNLLPIFPLDGGHTVDALLKKLNVGDGKILACGVAGVFVIVALAGLMFVTDISRLIK